MTINTNDYPPAQLLLDEDFYSVQVVGEDMLAYMDLFEAAGHYGNGYGWEGLVEHMLLGENPDLLNRCEFDSEGDACLIRLESPEDAVTLAKMIHDMVKNTTKMKQYLSEVDPEKLS